MEEFQLDHHAQASKPPQYDVWLPDLWCLNMLFPVDFVGREEPEALALGGGFEDPYCGN